MGIGESAGLAQLEKGMIKDGGNLTAVCNYVIGEFNEDGFFSNIVRG